MSRLLVLTAVAIAAACAQPAPEEPPPRPGATVAATVLTIRESSHPPTRALLHRIVVAGRWVRMSDELDRWRLFDLEEQTVTWVDDLTRTRRTLPLDDLVRARQRQIAAPLPATIRPVSVRRTDEEREIGGRMARRWVMELGGYQREMWVVDDPIVPPPFHRMWVASDPISEPFAGVLRHVQAALMDLDGFPVWDRSALRLDGGETLVFQRQLVKVESRDVPAGWMRVPSGYEDVTPPSLRSGAGRRPASSPPRDRSAREAE